MSWTLLLILVLCVAAEVHVNAIDLIGKEPEYGPAEYEFHYSVNDPHTGDIKSQKEIRKGDRVEGSYELIEPDGHRRLVKYAADDHHGFQAIVLREPTNIKIPIPEHQPRHHLIQENVAHAPLLQHYSRVSEPINSVQSLHSAPQYDNHVVFSSPHSQYKY